MSKLILALDVSTPDEVQDLCRMAKAAGATRVKIGLELLMALGPKECSQIADYYGLDWVADAKLHDIPQTVERAVRNLCRWGGGLFAITMHAGGGIEMMRRAQEAADEYAVKMLAVTVLTSETETDTRRHYHLWPETTMGVEYARRSWLGAGWELPDTARTWQVLEYVEDAWIAGVRGVVCSPMEIAAVKARYPDAWLMVPGTRSKGADAGDQKNVTTPAEAIAAGADALVIGSQVTGAEVSHKAYQAIQEEIGERVPA